MSTLTPSKNKEHAVVIYSGGMDSFTVLNKALLAGYKLHALSFNYGQRHAKELDYAASVCKAKGISHKIVDISAINSLLGGSSLTSDIDIPEGHHTEDNMKSTVVPNRNMILLSLATAYAISLKAEKVFYGAHAGDHTIYPDCRPEFVEAVNNVTQIADWQPVKIIAPYLYKSKITILKEGLAMGLDYSQTWTCYNGWEKACGKCGACQERLEAFTLNNCLDPLPYVADT